MMIDWPFSKKQKPSREQIEAEYKRAEKQRAELDAVAEELRRELDDASKRMKRKLGNVENS